MKIGKKKLMTVVPILVILVGLSLIFIFSRSSNKSRNCLSVLEDDISDKEIYHNAIKNCISKELILSNDKIYFPKSEITIDKGGAIILTLGILNKKDRPLRYKMQFTPVSNPDGIVFNIDNPPWFKFGKNYTNYTLAHGEVDLRSIRLNIPGNVKVGSYFLTLEVLDNDLGAPNNIYAKKDIKIIVASS